MLSANVLTASRAAAAPLVALAVLRGSPLAAGALFAWAVATDFADGALARRRGEASARGGLLDHTTDAFFCTCALGALAARGSVTPLLPVLVALAFTQYAVDSRVASGRALRASALGRWNGIAYYVLVGIPIVRDALAIGWPGAGLVRALSWVLVVSTLLSIADRLLAGKRSAQ